MGTDKGLVEFQGKQLVRYAIELIFPYCDDLIISANNREYEKFGFLVVRDEIRGVGPAGGLYSALRKSGTSFNLVVSCDMPLLNADAVELLIKNVSNEKNYIASHEKGIEPLFGVYHKNFSSVLEEAVAHGTYKLKVLLDMFPVEYISFNSLLKKHLALFRNLNYLSDLSI